MDSLVKNQMPPERGLRPKDRLRLDVVPRAARLASMLGIDWEHLGRKLGREVLLAQARRIDRTSTSPADRPLDVVFLSMQGGHSHNMSVDAVLGLALESRGHRVRFVLCDQALPVCEVKRAGHEADWERSCAKCYAFGKRFLESFGFEALPASVLASSAPSGLDRWNDVVEASLLKHYRVGVLPKNPQVDDRRRMFAQAARISGSIGRALAQLRPDLVVMSHGIYSTWGPQREILNEAAVPVVTYGKGKKKSVQKFNRGTSADWWDVSEEWERVRDVPLTTVQRDQIESYLASRRRHEGDTLAYNFADEESPESVRQRLQLDPSRRTFGLFTNVLWDAASAQREVAFRSPVDWVLETLEWFSVRPHLQLIVKIHPAELVIGTKQPFASIIAERFPTLPENIRIIHPAAEFNSWSIIRAIDLGLVHTSTVGMELPLVGTPCAVVSRTHYRERGFTIDVNSRDEYFQLIENWNPATVDHKGLRELALRYAYLLFERYQLPFPYFVEERHTDVRAFAFCDVNELLASDTIQIFLRAVETGGEFLLPG